LHSYQLSANALFFTFVNPADMPRVPPSFSNFAWTRGKSEPGAIPNSTWIIFSIGGKAYSETNWVWLQSQEDAEAMAEKVAKWPQEYGCDGIDLDIEMGAGEAETAELYLPQFVARLHEVAPTMIVNVAVFGSPTSVPSDNRVLEVAFNPFKNSSAFGAVKKVGIMVYDGTQSAKWADGYINGCKTCTQWWCPVDACVPPTSMVLGVNGHATAATINTLATDVRDRGLGGIMVWFASALNKATHKKGMYYYEPSDASDNASLSWSEALVTMQGKSLVV